MLTKIYIICTIKITNRIRYRGYYLDSETGYYYLQSRYYDPTICRFINADSVAIAYESRKEFLGANLFAYCCNDPVNYMDYDGEAKKSSNNTVDLNYKLSNAMLMNADSFYNYAKTRIDSALRSGVIKNDFSRINSAMSAVLQYFYNKVRNRGDWDLKVKWSLDTPNGRKKTYLFNNKKLRYDDPGNIHFGFVGYLLFPLKVLQSGAGVYQVKTGTSSFKYATTLFDDPRDYNMIKYGYNLAKQCGASTITQYLNKKMKSYPKYVWKIMTR